jgi:hypothetical protein
MKKSRAAQQLAISGTVVEAFERKGKPITRVSVGSFYIDIPSGYMQDAHLDDAVIIHGRLEIDGVQTDFSAPHNKSNLVN